MDKKQIILSCRAELATNRSKAENTALYFMAVAKNIPEFSSLDKQERELTFEIGKLDAQGKDVSAPKKELLAIKKQKNGVLLKNNINPLSLTPQYNCKICSDTGLVGNKYCDCLKLKIREKILQECGIGVANLHSFKDFDSNVATSENHKLQLEKIKKIFEETAQKFPNISKNFILLMGLPGVGKTFLSECLASELINKNHLVSFVTAFEMNNIMLSYHTCFDNKKQDYINSLLSPDVLIIDDLGTEPVLKNVTHEYLYLVLSERSRKNKLTIISTNLGLNNLLENYHERIFSRLTNKRESLLINIDGTDLRSFKK